MPPLLPKPQNLQSYQILVAQPRNPIRKDAMFRSFIQDKEVAKTLKPLVGFKSALESMKSGLATFQSKITVTEKDPWFKVNFFF